VYERPFGHTPGHTRHDRRLVARFTVGESLPGEAEEGRRLLEQCTDCARLAADLRLLRTSIAGLPTPARTRNFRLTAEQAERLRGNTFERLLRRLAMPGLTMLRPVAGVAMAIGLTIMVVGGALPAAAPVAAPTQREFTMNNGDDTAAPTGRAAALPTYEDSAKESDGSADIVSGPAGSPGVSGVGAPDQPSATAAIPPGGQDIPPTTPATDTSADTTRLLLIYGGTTLAMLSFGLLLLAWFARRRLEDPLLR
jgi:hypothetical protein